MANLYPELVMKAAKLAAETVRLLQTETETDSMVVRIEHDIVEWEVLYYCVQQQKTRHSIKALKYESLMMVDVFQEAKTWSQLMLNPEIPND